MKPRKEPLEDIGALREQLLQAAVQEELRELGNRLDPQFVQEMVGRLLITSDPHRFNH